MGPNELKLLIKDEPFDNFIELDSVIDYDITRTSVNHRARINFEDGEVIVVSIMRYKWLGKDYDVIIYKGEIVKIRKGVFGKKGLGENLRFYYPKERT